MVTEEMIEEARKGATVYFVTDEGVCMKLWIRGEVLQVSEATEGDCKN